LSGKIPEFLQRASKEVLSRQEGVRRDFSHNRLVGSIASSRAFDTLNISFNSTSNRDEINILEREISDKSLVAMDVNRLSGRIPRNSFIRRMPNIAILAGNLFACDSHNDLPKNDPHYHFYTCGSDSLDYPLLLWSVLCGSVVVVVIGVIIIAHLASWKFQSGGALLEDTVPTHEGKEAGYLTARVTGMVHSIRKVLSAADKTLRIWHSVVGQLDPVANMEVMKFMETLQFVRSTSLCITSFILSTFLLFYCLGKDQWGWYTHMDQYRWLYSAAFLSGNWAALVMVLLLIFVLALSTFMVQRFSDRSVSQVGGLAPTTLSVVSQSMSIDRKDTVPHKDIKNVASVVVCFFINSVVVLCVQGLFVYLTTWHNVSPPVVVAMQLLLACFTIVWDNVVVLKVLIARFPSYLTAKGRSQLQNMIFLFNGVVAPVIVVGLTDPNCFSELITNSGEISTTSSIEYCAFLGATRCTEFKTMV
jgi:hypothetical protein